MLGDWIRGQYPLPPCNSAATDERDTEQAFGVGVMTKFGGATLEEAQKLCKDAMADVLSRKGK